jgi:hypothetical protein
MNDIAKAMAYAADQARECQDACNASGVAIAFAKHMRTICDASNALQKGTAWKNQHPISFLFTYKLQALNGFEQLGLYKQYNWAEEECKQIAREVADDPQSIPTYRPYQEETN